MNIGIFDSGIGGLTIARKILSDSPAHIVYVADSANMPYGTKNSEQICNISSRIVRFLEIYNVDIIIIACHTASILAGEKIKQLYNHIPIITMQEYSIEHALQTTKNNIIGLIATPATIASYAYRKAFAYNKNIHLHEKACPKLASSIEDYFNKPEILHNTLELYLREILTTEIDTLILGCTHYSLIKELIQAYAPNIALVSSDDVVTEQFLVKENNSFITRNKHQFFVSGDQKVFQEKLEFFLNFWNIKNICYTLENTPWNIIK
jgi:glutamate racemase